MKIHIGSDHAGYEVKEKLKAHLAEKGLACVDCGTSNTESTDYPDYAAEVARRVAADRESRGVLVCGTGIGMSMAANKVAGVRAAVVHDEFTARMARAHNNANVLCLGARVVDGETAAHLVDIFLETPFEGGRHSRRVEKIDRLNAADTCGGSAE